MNIYVHIAHNLYEYWHKLSLYIGIGIQYLNFKFMDDFQLNFWTTVVVYWDKAKMKSRQSENLNSYKFQIIFGWVKCYF